MMTQTSVSRPRIWTSVFTKNKKVIQHFPTGKGWLGDFQIPLWEQEHTDLGSNPTAVFSFFSWCTRTVNALIPLLLGTDDQTKALCFICEWPIKCSSSALTLPKELKGTRLP